MGRRNLGEMFHVEHFWGLAVQAEAASPPLDERARFHLAKTGGIGSPQMLKTEGAKKNRRCFAGSA